MFGDEKCIKNVDGIRYANMAQCAEYLNCSPMGWRKLREHLVEQRELVLHRFEDDENNVYILGIDLEVLKIQLKR